MESMDRVQYAHSINTGNMDYNTLWINYFDQLMSVYGYIRPHNYQLYIIKAEGSSITINMEFVDENSASQIMSILSSSDGVMQMYGRIFHMKVFKASNNILQLQITE